FKYPPSMLATSSNHPLLNTIPHVVTALTVTICHHYCHRTHPAPFSLYSNQPRFAFSHRWNQFFKYLGRLPYNRVLRPLSTSYLDLKICPTSRLNHRINGFVLSVPISSGHQVGTNYNIHLDCNLYLEPIGAQNDRLMLLPQALMVPASISLANTGTCLI
ncbi:hypothetical protein PTTG_30001, partial [Puccinia triticina 1-1 BBBD Race 1]